MSVIFGMLFVTGAIIAGFTMAGGHVAALVHPSEIVTIGGAALGAMIVMAPTNVLFDVVKGVLTTIKGSPFNKAMYLDTFSVLYELFRMGRRDGLLAWDAHLSNPHESSVFNARPRVANNHHVTDFLCGALTSATDGNISAEQLQEMLESEIRLMEEEHHAAAGAMAKTADSLPGFGIVAAVLGIVITMEAVDGPVSEIGHKVGAALVGTFLGILMSYGFLSPLAGRMEFLGLAESAYFRVLTGAIVAFHQGGSPKGILQQQRRVITATCRPSREELDELFKEGG